MSKDLIPSHDELKAIDIMAKQAVESRYVDKLGGYAGVFSIAMYARELGIPVMSALFGGMANILGKITIAPQLMNAMIRKAGHKLKIDSTDQRCIIEGIRRDTGESCSVSFSVEDARKAGLVKSGGGWEKYPSDMCFARALSRLARRLFPDVIGMAYVEGEVEDEKESKDDDKKIETLEGDTKVNDADRRTEIQEICEKFQDKFDSIDHKDWDLSAYVRFVAEKVKKPMEDVMKSALNQIEKFSKSYLEWVDEKIATKAPGANVEQLDMLSPKASSKSAESTV